MKLDLDAEAVIIEAFGLVESPMQDSTGFTICSFPGEISPAAVTYSGGGLDGWTLPLTGRKPHAAWHLGARLMRLYGDSGSDAFEIPPFSSVEELRLKLEATRR